MKKIYFGILSFVIIQQGLAQFCDNATYLNIGGRTPVGITSNDLDGDGNIDLITGINSAAEVVINYGNGNGTFGPSIILPVFSAVYDWSGIKVADFNNDNILDIVCNNHTSNKCSIILSTGARTYASYTSINTPSMPLGVVVKDFNGDNNQDFATSNYGGNSVSVFLGNGSGGFSPAASYVSLANPYDMSGGDFNNDGNFDLIASCGSSLCIFPGNPDGTFGTRIDLSGADGNTVTSGDYNNDGDLDVSVSIGGNLGVALGNGDFTFGSLATYTSSKSPLHMTAADYDNDGDLDVMGGASDAFVVLFFNNGAGNFTSSSIWSSAN